MIFFFKPVVWFVDRFLGVRLHRGILGKGLDNIQGFNKERKQGYDVDKKGNCCRKGMYFVAFAGFTSASLVLRGLLKGLAKKPVGGGLMEMTSWLVHRLNVGGGSCHCRAERLTVATCER